MKEQIKKNLKLIVIVIVLLFIGTFGYNYMNKKEPFGVEEEVYKTNIDKEAEDILKTLDAISKIKIDNKFFSSKNIEEGGNLLPFYSFVNFSIEELAQKPVGKENPFLAGSTLNDNPFKDVKKPIEKKEEKKNIEENKALTPEEKEVIKNN